MRNQIVFATTMFKAVCYYQPDECQIITTGEDRKVSSDGLYQLKVDVGMLNTVKNYLVEILSVSPSPEQNAGFEVSSSPLV